MRAALLVHSVQQDCTPVLGPEAIHSVGQRFDSGVGSDGINLQKTKGKAKPSSGEMYT